MSSLPVAYNGIPDIIRAALTMPLPGEKIRSPHSVLRDWTGTINNPFFGVLPLKYKGDQNRNLESPFRINLNQISPLYDHKLGSVVWAIKDNWSILMDAAYPS